MLLSVSTHALLLIYLLRKWSLARFSSALPLSGEKVDVLMRPTQFGINVMNDPLVSALNRGIAS